MGTNSAAAFEKVYGQPLSVLDDKIKEISPGVFYNVWTFNGTIPGPTIRATEGDHISVGLRNITNTGDITINEATFVIFKIS